MFLAIYLATIIITDSLNIDSSKVRLVDSLEVRLSIKQTIQFSKIDSLFVNIREDIKFIKSKKKGKKNE